MKKLFASILLCAVLGSSVAQSQTKKIIDNSLATISKNKGAKYTLKQTERFNGKTTFRTAEIFTKINAAIGGIYAKIMTDPNKGTELLYLKGQNSGKVKVNAGKLVPTLNLAPTSGLLTKDQHHTMLNSGFNFIVKILSDGIKRSEAQGKFDEVFKYEGDVNYAGKTCYKIVATDPTFKTTTVVAKQGENLFTLATRLLISEFHIMEMNNIKSFEADLSGKTIKVPTSYAAKTILYIDKATNYPLYLEMHDEKGMFEKYEFKDLIINPAFKSDEFSADFSEYNF